MHFGDDRELATITEANAEDFELYLIGEGLASTTVHKRLQFARMFFRAAKKAKLIEENPFSEVSANAVLQNDRQRLLTREEADRLLAICDPTWRVIVALARYGGLRCPSEVLSLRWEDLNWETGRIHGAIAEDSTSRWQSKPNRSLVSRAALDPGRSL